MTENLPESVIQKKCLLALSKEGCMVWRANVGMAVPWTQFTGYVSMLISAVMRGHERPQTPRPITFGVAGAPDIQGVAPGGRALGVEVKSEKGRQSAQQKQFQRAWEAAGGIYILTRSEEDCIEQLRQHCDRHQSDSRS